MATDLKALRLNLERDIARCPLEHCTDDDIAYCGQCGWTATALQLLADAETLAQIRALRDKWRVMDSPEDFALDVYDVLDGLTTSSGHVTTNPKGDQ
jgi:hypothetical protein